MVRWGMVIDLDKCSGCQACGVACAAESNVAPGSPREAWKGRLIRWLQFLPQAEGTYPNVAAALQPMMCQQCDRPACTYVCPVSATYPNPQGIVAQIYWRCIGCRYCINACPYTTKWFNWWEPQWAGNTAKATNPDVELRQKGISEKCLFCSHRLQRAKERARAERRPLASHEYVPACVEACPTGAIVFGDLEDPQSEVSKLARSPRAFRVLEELGTKPKVIYLKST
ncbi:MAG: 4Fe-4S dicluster domain-containing protein [Planctomycetes bacterium]|nr:4Fe-4S dicluster domain-containing protein [Planctomycetota bacterium]